MRSLQNWAVVATVVAAICGCSDKKEAAAVTADPVVATGCTSANDCDTGTVCTGDPVCVNHVCSFSSKEVKARINVACDDDNACTLRERCDGKGACVPEVKDCNDNNPCTADTCDAIQGCMHSAGVGNCDDGNKCTEADTCVAGGCIGTPSKCDDGNSCTEDYCLSWKGCQSTKVEGGACEDGNPCANIKKCIAGACLSTNACDDGNQCTTDTCDPKAGCQHSVAADGTGCNDGTAATGSDSCQSGSCVGLPIWQCTSDAQCTGAQMIKIACAKQFCLVPAGKNIGTCQAAIDTAQVIDDKNSCTADSCDMTTGAATHKPLTGNCNDGNLCTSGDACDAGGFCVGKVVSCDDGNPCTVDACDGKSGQCTFGLINCKDGDAQTADSCDKNAPTLGQLCVHTQKQFSVSCTAPSKDLLPAELQVLNVLGCKVDVTFTSQDGLVTTKSAPDAGALMIGAKDICLKPASVTLHPRLCTDTDCNTEYPAKLAADGKWVSIIDPTSVAEAVLKPTKPTATGGLVYQFLGTPLTCQAIE